MTKAADLPYRPCVGIMLANDEGLVFVGRRKDTPEAWQMPQGGIDPGETPGQAALRELEEEIGTARAEILAETQGWLRYDLPPDLLGKVWGGRWRGQEQKWVLCRFTGRDADVNLATAHPEFDAWRWVRPEETVELIVPFKRDIYRAVVAELAPRIPR
ncbi:RNA pyrophosphohydrolase [Arenibaculum pallidiluteum]|uniref:RNA pyrophosphohydrolase n=1 Tax=Arenibaculum pallidiluteum TaxID=2812559 RepID=UPI001A958904|nr:RNA pyrophosphohydrolase [Arenibaculum pallidiluteum]